MGGWLESLLCAYLPCAMHQLGACLLALKLVSSWDLGRNIYTHGMVQQHYDNEHDTL